MRERRAEVGHAPPHHEAADRTGRDRHSDPSCERTQKEVLHHG